MLHTILHRLTDFDFIDILQEITGDIAYQNPGRVLDAYRLDVHKALRIYRLVATHTGTVQLV